MPVLADFASRRRIAFPLLSDAGSAVIKQYGILNTTVAPTNTTYGIPFPGAFFLDANGVVTSRHFEAAYQERDTIMSVLVKRGVKAARLAMKIEAPHLALTTYVTDDVAAPGTHFSAVVEAAPGPHIHVYAPGVAGYKPIAIDVRPQPGLVVRSAQYPKPEDYFFKPLDEHVAVYQRPFRIVQDFEIDPAPQAADALKERREMSIAGTLAYQACDDKVCFTPQSVPLTWTIALRPLDRERASPRP